MSQREPLALDLSLATEIAAGLEEPFAATGVRRFEGASADVFEIAGANGRGVIVKVYPDEPAWKLRKEAFVAERFAAVAQVPRWLAIDESRVRLPRRFVVMSRLPGASLRARFGQPEADGLFRAMGALARELHVIRVPCFGYLREAEVATSFATNAEFMATYFASKFRDFARWGGDRALRGRLEAFVAERAAALAECPHPVLCHNDLHPGNVLADQAADGAWALSGLIDFENALSADPLFDLAKALDYTAHECPEGRTLLAEGYGALERPGAAEAVLLYRIFHKLELLNWFEALGANGPANAALLADLAEIVEG